VFDLDAGRCGSLPKAGNRFMSMMVVNEDHYVYSRLHSVITISPEPKSARYVFMALRILSTLPIRKT
jgi:hypothetical protein